MKRNCLRLLCIFFLFLLYLVGGNLSFHPIQANAVSTVTTAIPTAWNFSRQHNIIYNGTNFIVFYTKGSTEIYARAAATVSGLSSASEQGLTALAGVSMTSGTPWDIYWVNDTKFDFVYMNTTTAFKVTTCTLSGTTISCGTPSGTTASSAAGDISVVRNPSSNKIWVAVERSSGSTQIFEAGTAGDAAGNTYTQIANSANGTSPSKAFIVGVPYSSADKVLYVNLANNNKSSSVGFTYRVCTTTCSGGGIITTTGSSSYNTTNGSKDGSLIRVSDTDFRFVYVDVSTTTNLLEAQFNGTSTWSPTFATIDSGGGQTFPSLFYDSISHDEYAFYVDSGNHIQRYRKPSGAGWDALSKTQVDGAETTANSIPVTQLVEPPPGSARTVPRELSWCYRTANGSNFNIICDHFNLASAGSLSLTAPSSTTLSSVTLAPTVQSSTGSLGTTTVDDTRGGSPGWNLTITCNDFTTGIHTIGVTNLTINPNNSTLAVISGSGTGVTAGSSHTFTSTSDAATIMTASSGNGTGEYTINPGLSLNIPIGSYAGNYTTTITETVT